MMPQKEREKVSLKRLRKLHNMTQLDVCRALNCPRPLYQMMESGKSGILDQYVTPLAELFCVSESCLRAQDK